MSKNPHAQALGKAGGTARAAKMNKAERSQSARNAAAARWKDHKPSKKQDKPKRRTRLKALGRLRTR